MKHYDLPQSCYFDTFNATVIFADVTDVEMEAKYVSVSGCTILWYFRISAGL